MNAVTKKGGTDMAFISILLIDLVLLCVLATSVIASIALIAAAVVMFVESGREGTKKTGAIICLVLGLAAAVPAIWFTLTSLF